MLMPHEPFQEKHIKHFKKLLKVYLPEQIHDLYGANPDTVRTEVKKVADKQLETVASLPKINNRNALLITDACRKLTETQIHIALLDLRYFLNEWERYNKVEGNTGKYAYMKSEVVELIHKANDEFMGKIAERELIKSLMIKSQDLSKLKYLVEMYKTEIAVGPILMWALDAVEKSDLKPPELKESVIKYLERKIGEEGGKEGDYHTFESWGRFSEY